MSDNESVDVIEKPKAKRNYVRTPARDEAIRKMREALAAKKGLPAPTQQVQVTTQIVDPTPKVEEKVIINKVAEIPKKQIHKQVSQVVDLKEDVEDATPIVIKKKATKKKPTVVYIESDSEESEAEKIIIKKKSKKSKKKVVSSSEEESESDDEPPTPPTPKASSRPAFTAFAPPKLRFL